MGIYRERIHKPFQNIKKSISSSALSLLYDSTATSLLWVLTTGKTITLTIWTFTGEMVSLLFNMQPGFFIAFLPTSKCFVLFCFVLFFHFMATATISVLWEPKKIKFVTASTLVWQYNIGHVPWCFPGESAVKNCLQCRRPEFNPWIRKIPGEGMTTHSSIFAGGFHGQRSYSQWSRKRVGHDWGTEHASS